MTISAEQRPAPPVHRERRRRQMGWGSGDVLRAAALVVGLYVLVRLLWFASSIFFVIFLGVLFGLAVSAGADWLERFRVPRGLASAAIVLTAVGALFGFGVLVAPTVRTQAAEVRDRLPEAIDRIERWLEERQDGSLGFLFGAVTDAPMPTATETPDGRPAPAAAAGDTTAAAAQVPLARADTAARDTAAAGTAAETVETATAAGDTVALGVPDEDTIVVKVAEPQTPLTPPVPVVQPPEGSLGRRLEIQASDAARYLFPFLSSTLAVLGGVVLILFIAIYLAADPDLYRRGLMHLFPHRMRPRAGEVLSATATVLRRWLLTQFIGMVTIGVVTSITLKVMGVRAPFALGVLAGLLEFIPTIGPILSAVPAIAMGFLDSPQTALWVAVAYIIIQQVESNVLIPLLMQEGVEVPPVLTITVQAVMAIVFGFLGLLVAVPLLAAVIVPIKLLYVEGVVGDDVEVLGEEEPAGAAAGD